MAQMTAADLARLDPNAFEPRAYAALNDSSFMRLLMGSEPWPHHVYSVGGVISYCPPEVFRFLPKLGPSDSIWIVPGTS